ncbi:extracellular solute-binding protein [Treponema sp. OMZ 840]|uniref:ABC transporter substrate-binding protein n=1 Tax=Treponema sp. OMZ 840 TaxID=244313 RepID=UPI003D8A2626
MKKNLGVLIVSMQLLCCLLAGCNEKTEKTKIVYWSMWRKEEPQAQVILDAAKAFTRETDIIVDIVFNGRNIRSALLPALNAGEPIDVFDEDIERVSSEWKDYLLPLDEYTAKAYPTTEGKPYSTVLNKQLYNLAKELGGGTVKNIPYQPSAFVVMYNKDLFAQAGIEKPPKTWSEFLRVCERLKAIGVPAITVDDLYMACLFGYNMDRLVGERATLNMIQNKDFSGWQVLEFGKIWENMAKKGYISADAASNVWPAGQNEMAAGKVAMYLNGTWLPNEIKNRAPHFKWGAFAWPAMSPKGDGIEANNYGSQSFAVNKNSKHPEAAFRFIVWLTTGDWDAVLADESIGIPAGNNTPWPAQLAEANVIVNNTTNRLDWAVGMEKSPQIHAKIQENFKKLISGELNAAGFASAMHIDSRRGGNQIF